MSNNLLLALLLALVGTTATFAQTAAVAQSGQLADKNTPATGNSKTDSNPALFGSVAENRLRFSALGELLQLRLEIISPTGETLFDSGFKAGNVVDWLAPDKQGQPLGEGAYLCDNVEFGTNGANLTFRPNESEAMRITTTGRVGIGITNPAQKLHVSGAGIVRALVNSDSNAGLAVGLGGVPKWSVATVAPGNFQIFNETNGQNAMFIDAASNNVGIGLTNPTDKLHVSGTGVIRALVNSDSNAGLGLSLNNQKKWSMATTNGDFQLFNEATATNTLLVNSSTNNVTIGTTPTGGRLAVFTSGALGLQVAVGSTVARSHGSAKMASFRSTTRYLLADVFA